MDTSTQQFLLKPEIIGQVKENQAIIHRILTDCNVSYPTIMRWLRENDDNLTKAKILHIIGSELNMDKDDLLQVA